MFLPKRHRKEKKYRIQLQSSRQHVKNKHDFRQIREICEATHWSDDFKSGSDIVYCGKYCREIRNKIEFVKGYNENGSDKNNEKENNIYAKFVEEGKIKEKGIELYSRIISEYQSRLKGYTHKDQKPYWT